jgi:hypothetical protein
MAPALISRSGSESPATQEQIAAGAEFNLMPGDALVAPAQAVGELRNDGEEPAVVLAAVLQPKSQDTAVGFPGTPVAKLSVDGSDETLVVALAVVLSPPCPGGHLPSEAHASPVGGGGGGEGSVAVAIAAVPACEGDTGTPVP